LQSIAWNFKEKFYRRILIILHAYNSRINFQRMKHYSNAT